MRGGNPVLAFFVTSVVIACGLNAVVLWRLWGDGPEARFDLSRDGGAVAFGFVLAWFFTIVAGTVVGMPVLLGLRRLGLHQRLAALLLAGLLAGTFFSLMLGIWATGDLSVTDDPSFIALGSGAGLVAGALWWLFTAGLRRNNG